jgi:glycosyltransferase involved in cell wall biosynthesis
VKISVVVPTKQQPNPLTGRPYFERAVASIEAQRVDAEVEAIVGCELSPVRVGQARSVNEAVARADGDVLTLLEDDDRWDPGKLAAQIRFLDQFELVTCNQREVDEHDRFLGYSYYPTPSGWLMRRSTWDRVGGLDETLQFHSDTDWLGRATLAGVQRVHLVQAAADPSVDQWVRNMASSSIMIGPTPEPLVTRTVREASMSGQIRNDQKSRAASQRDFETIKGRFGRVPW